MKDEEKTNENIKVGDEIKEKNTPLDMARGDSTESEVVDFEYNDNDEEDFSPGADQSSAEKIIKKLRADLVACKKEKAEYLDGWQKERADFINYKKQEEDRKSNFSEAMRERIIMRFLTVLDSFDMAFANRESWQKVDESWRKGIEYIYSQMNSVFEEFGVKPIGEVGESFDPSIHQSIEVVTTDKKEDDHKVAEVTQKGYKLGDPSTNSGHGRVIRPARVNIFEYNENK